MEGVRHITRHQCKVKKIFPSEDLTFQFFQFKKNISTKFNPEYKIQNPENMI